jgi:hypothetical protein
VIRDADLTLENTRRQPLRDQHQVTVIGFLYI